MTKLLRVGDYVLIGAAIAGEIFENIRLVGGIMPSIMNSRYGFVPPNFKKQSYLSSIRRLLVTGEIVKKVSSKGEVYLELSDSGKSKFKRKFPIFNLQKTKWDRTFMVVSFDIGEKDRYLRDIFRSKLIELGFGQMQKSVWISPYHFEEDLKEFIDSKDLSEFAIVLKAEALLVENIMEFASKVWKLEKINEEYKSLLNLITNYLRSNNENGKSDLTKQVVNRSMKELWNGYFDILQRDPFLPEDLLPSDWCGKTVSVKMKDLALMKTPRSTV